jgi:integrase
MRRRKKIGPSKRVAQEVLNDTLAKIARREHLGVIEDSAIGFAEFTKIWWERIAPTIKRRTKERWLGIVETHLKPAFPGSLRAINSSQVEKYIAGRIEHGTAPATVNREITVLKHMLKRAVLWEYLSANPIDCLKALKEPSGRTRFLSPEEIDQLLLACEFEDARSPLAQAYIRPFVIIALNTGMRRNEILSLVRKSVDWLNRIATLETTKNGEKRHVFLNDVAIDALKSLPARLDTDRLFPFGPNQISMALRRVINRSGIVDFRLHDLRHTFASYQAMSGVQGRGLQALLGHKDNRMTMRYSHLSDAYLRAAVEGVRLGGSPESAARLLKNGTYLAPNASESLARGGK